MMKMREKPTEFAENYRFTPDKAKDENHPMLSTAEYGNNGVFIFPMKSGEIMRCIISDQKGWDHVSVSIEKPRKKKPKQVTTRMPNWREMHQAKMIFWDDDEVVMQIHPAKEDHINLHPHVLHLWKPQRQDIPLPPKDMV
jgi:hypothetical protein